MAKSTTVNIGSKPTVKGTIQELVKRGRTMEAILKEIKKKFPDSKADANHVKYYSNELKRAGEITEDQHAKYLTAAKKAAPAKTKTPAKTKAKKKTPADKKAGRVRVKTGAQKGKK